MDLTPEQTAAQLRCPHGREAAAFGQIMNLRNLAQILACLETLQIRTGSCLLEIGCGNGGLLGWILSQNENLRYTGLEVSEAMYREACGFNQAFIEAGLAQYRLHGGGKLPFSDGRFDMLFSVNTVYFWPDPAEMLAECARVLKCGGRMCLSFCEKAFMETLPFAAYGFSLYNAADIRAVAAPLPLNALAETRRSDWAVSKSNGLVRRETVHLLFEKQYSESK